MTAQLPLGLAEAPATSGALAGAASPASAAPAAPVTSSMADWPKASTAWYAVGVLLLAYTLAYVDRAVLTILVEPIQRDLGINDTGVGLLHGFAFVIFYVTLGLPLGYIVDRTNRKRLIIASIAFWSLMTATCGLAKTFGQLFAARIGVGIGEAGLSPASYSMISDYFPPQRRTFALGVYTIALFLGGGMAILIGGVVVGLVGEQPEFQVPLLGPMRSWQVVFMIVASPGLLIALLAMTIREPLRRIDKGASISTSAPIAQQIAEMWRHLKRYRAAYSLHMLGFAFLGVPFNVVLLWARPYLSRQFGVERADAAYMIGGTMVVCATAGILCGSALSDRLQARGRTDATIRVALGASALILIPVLAFPWMPSASLACVAFGALLFLGASPFGAAPAALQLITPNSMRGLVSAMYLFIANVVALTVGPIFTGVLTDYLFKDPKAVGYSASIVAAFAVALAFVLFCFLLRRFRLAAAEQSGELPTEAAPRQSPNLPPNAPRSA